MGPGTTQGSYWKSQSAEGEEGIDISSVATAELLMLQQTTPHQCQ